MSRNRNLGEREQSTRISCAGTVAPYAFVLAFNGRLMLSSCKRFTRSGKASLSVPSPPLGKHDKISISLNYLSAELRLAHALQDEGPGLQRRREFQGNASS